MFYDFGITLYFTTPLIPRVRIAVECDYAWECGAKLIVRGTAGANGEAVGAAGTMTRSRFHCRSPT